MPPAFSAAEKARITRLLLDNGLRLFTTQGLRKTSLEDLVAGTGIAKSTFYVFFDSKEALYLELMLAQMAEVKSRVIDGALRKEPDTRAGLRAFLHATLAELDGNPLYGRLMTHPEEMEAVVRKLDPERVTSAPDNPVSALAAYLAEHRDDLAGDDPEVIVGVLQAVLMMPLHRDRLASPDLYEKILDRLIDIVATGLTRPQR
ncbi:Transcriptional regulator, TetR family [[Actinomadura] parvosata subsp. kistnae]|uniref:TetR family transcriptional regulator n=1 Tax=[Actinomadura] parvosata subsp. kistnae TaxID=1909395 RepID=A0A1U9ZZ94_9ACTN|nr:TetR/AcrR family transcriptional regulator [Nonomuraea sp. ATCC 55076]AQZ63283.1 TetR family transcriptional regulator [Nonomuraea sp. ATCC 55076]SPL98972.1 Transcriptional regulator, TetR family [Actinomadura parvosata subsp. kistnae]